MKEIISTLSLMLIMAVFVESAQGCNGATVDNFTTEKAVRTETQKTSQVKAYYFHATRRCPTCVAVEAVSKEAINEYYGDKVTFESINWEEEKDNPLVKQYKISGTSLIIINGDKKEDLTNDAFMNARTNPDKFKSKLKSTIDSMM